MPSHHATGEAPTILKICDPPPPPAVEERTSSSSVSAAIHDGEAWGGGRDQPLGFLFILATAAVDLVLLAKDVDRLALAGAGLAQMSVAAITLIRCRAHRLTRAALAVALLGCVKLLAAKGSDQMFPHLALFAALQASLLLGCEAVAAAWRWRRGELRFPRPSYPLVELFGWPIIVAAATALLRSATRMDQSEFQVGELAVLALGSTTAYAALVIWELGFARGIVLSVLATALANYLLDAPAQARHDVWMLTLLHTGYVLLWIAAGKFDQQTRAARNAARLADE